MNDVLRTFVENHLLIISLLPAIISISVAFVYKNVFISLGLGLYVGLVVDTFIKGHNLLASLIFGIFNLPIFLTNSLSSPTNAGIVLQILLISGLIYLLTYTGGLKALASSITKYASSREKAQFITWVMGLVVFFDDYANALIVGPVMRNITDKMNVSREKLAFIIDATAAPIAGLALISTWIGYEITLISEQLTAVGIDASPMGVFLGSLPFRFYNVLMLIFIVMTIYTKREFGPMYDAEIRAIKGRPSEPEHTYNPEEEELKEVKENKNYKAKVYEGIIPLVVLIVGAFYFFYQSGATIVMNNPDPDAPKLVPVHNIVDFLRNFALAFSNADTSVVLSQAAFLAIVVTFIISGSRGAFKIKEGIDLTLEGASKLVPTAFVLLLAWSLGTIMDAEHLNTGSNIAALLGDSLPYQIVPLIIFIISSVMAFATGTSYGTMGILFPLAIPLAYATNTDINFIILVVSSILTGTILGDHCSPISDTTLLSSAGAEVDHIEHVRTQMPYAIAVGSISALGYLIAGFTMGLNINGVIYIIYIYAALIFLMYLVLRGLGKKVH